MMNKNKQQTLIALFVTLLMFFTAIPQSSYADVFLTTEEHL